jgi:RNA polymerase sigma factor (sigma-70 family)
MSIQDYTARNELALAYQPIVQTAARRLSRKVGRLWPVEDLKGYGQVALLEALDSYNPERSGDRDMYVAVKVRYGLLDQLRALNHRHSGKDEGPRVCSLDETHIAVDPAKLPDTLADHAMIWRFVEALPELLQRVIRLYYVEGLTHPEIGERVGYKQARISQLRKQALEMLTWMVRREA